MSSSSQTLPAARKDHTVFSHPKSSFGVRFHKPGQPNVYFRSEPDLRSDPNQTWVALDTSEIKFENYNLQNIPRFLDSALSGEDVDNTDIRSPKRQKIDSTMQSKAAKTPAVAIGFRIDKPLNTEIPDDIWRIILKESHPSVLLLIKNLSRRFHGLLQEQSIWKASRVKQHGENMPDPPGDMTEQRYAHLLYGQGCDFQRSRCGSNVTKKVYWPFRLRMCDPCFRRKIEKDKSVRATTFSRVSPLTEIGFDLCEFIPAGMTSSGKYIRTRQHDGSLWEPHSRAVYLRSDVDAILSEYRDMVVAGTSTSEIDSWKAEKSSENRTLLAQCARIEEFQKKVAAEQPRHREARAGFFAAQGANLTPPLGIDVMEKIMAFKMSLDSNHEPTMRSWGDLKKKLLPHRAAAEELLHLIKVNQRFRAFGEPSLAIDNFRSLHSLRSRAPPSKSLQPEQLYVINLGRQQLTKCKDRAVADADLVLLVLKGVFDEYQCLPTAAKPYGTNADNSRGIYRLTLDDARMIVQHVIEPEVQSWNDALRSREVLAKFKCVGCVRKDCTTRYTFDSVFQHIHEKHSIYVSEGEDFHKLYRPFDDTILEVDFPWYTVEWPRNLPVAASHQEVSKEKKWLADAEVNYVPLSSPETPSVFLDRRACVPAGIGSSDFEGNLCYAATKLRPTTLSVACQLRIVLQYALDRYVVDHGIVKPSLADFMACLPKLQAANEDFTLTFSCGVCKQNPDIPQSAIHTRPETLTKLKDHFDKIHHTSDWTLSFVDSPSDTQLASILQDADVRLKEEKRATLRRQASLAKNPRKKADPNAQMILQKPEAMTVFDELFPRVEVEA